MQFPEVGEEKRNCHNVWGRMSGSESETNQGLIILETNTQIKKALCF